ncbi:MAG: hypothetical protein J6V11_04290, partial [Alphaproteobacteria bacterium]|nr:hypothetical protein [Alphaproteobacteria bacterium]
RCDATYSSTESKCYSCDKLSTWNMTKEDCDACSDKNPAVTKMGSGCFNCKTFGYYPSAEKAQCEKCMAINENIIFYPKDAAGTSKTGLCTTCDIQANYKPNGSKNSEGTACVALD